MERYPSAISPYASKSTITKMKIGPRQCSTMWKTLNLTIFRNGKGNPELEFRERLINDHSSPMGITGKVDKVNLYL